MNIIPRNSLFDLDSVFDNFFTPMQKLHSLEGDFTPRVDVREKDNHYEITAELPGVKKEDLDISLDQGMLTIKAENHFEDKEEKDGRIIRQERRYGKFVRSFNLGNAVNEDEIKASFKDGILTLSAPKRAEPKSEKRTVAVS